VHDSGQLGLTLIEILVTIVISGLFFAAMVPVFVMAAQQSGTDRARIQATNTAQSVIERLRDLPYGHLWDTTWSSQSEAEAALGEDFQWRGASSDITIEVTPYPEVNEDGTVTEEGEEDYMLALVTASWQGEKGRERSVTLRTAIYRQGLGSETLVLEVRPLPEGYIRLEDLPVTVSAQLNAADAASVERIDFTIYANNGTRVEEWSVATDDAIRPDGSVIWYYEHEWAAVDADGQPLADGRYSFVAKTVPIQPEDPEEIVPAAEWAQKEYLLNRAAPGTPVILVGEQGFRKLDVNDVSPTPFVYLRWKLETPISDVHHFEIERTGTGLDGSAIPAKSVTLPNWTTEWTDDSVAAGTTYTYRVRAWDKTFEDNVNEGDGQWSDAREVAVAEAGLGSVPAPPTGVTNIVDDRAVETHWAASPDANSVDAYRIYRTGSDGVRLLVMTRTVDPGTTDPSQLTFTDIFVEYNQTYTYYVTAVKLPSGGPQWESASSGGYPVHVPEPPKVGMKIDVRVQSGPVPDSARLVIHSLESGLFYPENPWDYPEIKPQSSQESQNTWTTGPILYPGLYDVIAVCYWKDKKAVVSASFTSEAVSVSSIDTVVHVYCTHPDY
jgi:type II secretory pathway pseudopilin PulG